MSAVTPVSSSRRLHLVLSGICATLVTGFCSTAGAQNLCADLKAAMAERVDLAKLKGAPIPKGHRFSGFNNWPPRWFADRRMASYETCFVSEEGRLRFECEDLQPTIEAARKRIAADGERLKACWPDGKVVSSSSNALAIDIRDTSVKIRTDTESHGPLIRITLEDSAAERAMQDAKSKLISLKYSDTGNGYADPASLAAAGEALVRDARALYGDGTARTATVLASVAAAFKSNDDFDRANDYYRQAVEEWDRGNGTGSFDLEGTLDRWRFPLKSAGRFQEEASVLRRLYQLVAGDKGEASSEATQILTSLASALKAGGEWREADRWLEKGIGLLENSKAPDNNLLMSLINTYALQQEASGNDTAAEALLRRALTLEAKRLKAEKLENRDFILHSRGEPQVHINLATFYESRNRPLDAEKVLNEARSFMSGLVGVKSEAMIPILLRLADHHSERKRHKQAIDFVRAVLAINREKDGYYIEIKAKEGIAENAAGQFETASRTLQALRIEARRLSDPKDRWIGEMAVLPHLTASYRRAGQPEKALEAGGRFVELLANMPDGETASNFASVESLTRSEMGRAYLARGKTREAWEEIRRAVDLARGINKRGMELRGDGRSSAFAADDRFTHDLLALLYELQDADPGNRRRLAMLALDLAQTLRSTAAERAISQLAQRAKARDGELAGLIRTLQDQQQQRDALSKRLAALRGQQAAPADAAEAARIAASIGTIDANLARSEFELAQRQMKVEELLRPTAVAASELPGLIGDDEAIVQLVSGPAALDVWIVTGADIRWRRLAQGAAAVADRVRALRCGLDDTSWRGKGEGDCQKLLGTDFSRADIEANKDLDVHHWKPLPFDLERAHELYAGLLGQDEDLLKTGNGTWRELLIVTTGPLASLPFQVLVTEGPVRRFNKTANDLLRIAWLGRRQSIASLPSLSSLKALRLDASKGAAARPYIGFGNPTLEGRTSNAYDRTMKPFAAAWQSCTNTYQTGECRATFPSLSRGQPLRPGKIREWSPLPQTACELCTIGSRLKVTDVDSEVRLGARATEKEVKRLGTVSAGAQRSELENYRIIHFATHGTAANRATGYAEPGLILTPPPDGQESDNDDGYLAASEVVGLKLDADWVILSACNTAAGTLEDADAFSGLARAFFYAGARSLLVSNWEVSTGAAVELTTRALGRLETDAGIGRTAAIHLAIKSMIEDAEAQPKLNAAHLHPSYWGAFSIVGEGNAAAAARAQEQRLAAARTEVERQRTLPRPGDVFRDCDGCPEMIVVPAGSFVMGNSAYKDESPAHKVTTSSPFAVSRFEVTFDEWAACAAGGGCLGNPTPADRDWGKGRRPVIYVSWDDAKEFVAWLSRKTGKAYRLLSEAEWEYAARAGTRTEYSWGNDVGRGNANCRGCGSQWDNKQSAPVGSFQPNAFGLYDVHGNVAEWVEDAWQSSYKDARLDGTVSTGGSSVDRVTRGGYSEGSPTSARSSSRSEFPRDLRARYIGLRVARTL